MPRPGNVCRHARFPKRILSIVAIGELNERFGVLFARTLFDPGVHREGIGGYDPPRDTFHSPENLTPTSPAPIPGPLAGMEEELGKACAIQPIFQNLPSRTDFNPIRLTRMRYIYETKGSSTITTWEP
jgi:hypothetical protein